MNYRNNILIVCCLAFLSFFCTEIQAQCLSGNCVDGVGKYRFPTGAVYTGHFQKGQFHGWGKCEYEDGIVYEGEWLERLPHGKGTLTISDGSQFTGTWFKGNLQGDSENEEVKNAIEKNIENGNIQLGCLHGDCQNGYGIMSFPNGDKYEGEFKDGEFHGQCKWIYADGRVYEGSFSNNYSHGYGRVVLGDSIVTSGIWEQGVYLADTKAAIVPNCNEVDCGNVRIGEYTYKNNVKYIGEFLDGKPYGWGKVDYGNSKYYEGEWKNNIANGVGTYSDGVREHYGIWEEGKLVLAKGKPNKKTREQQTKPQEYITPHQEGTKVWIVVVGVSSYSHMKPLKYSDNDAFRFMGLMLSPTGGAIPDEQIRVLVDEDATKDNVIQSMKELFTQADEDDLVMLYFSGHGLVGAFLPIDYNGYDNKLYHEEIQAIFASSRAKYKLCIADACHAGSYNFSSKGDIEDIVSEYYTNLSKASGGTALMLSSKPEETSLESYRIRQGVFSHFLLRGMKGEADYNKDKIVTLGELFSYISQNVKQYTSFKQSPVLKGDFDTNMPISVVR